MKLKLRTNKTAKEETLPQGQKVFWCGVAGFVLGATPAVMLFPEMPVLCLPWKVLFPIAWACFVGCPITYVWSYLLHERIKVLRYREKLTPEEKRQYPDRVRWMPAWIGIFERALYCILIGLDVAGGAAFIAFWVGIKLAGGWQVWSKGTTYGRAILFAGLLGNAMSIWFGVIAGLVIRFHNR